MSATNVLFFAALLSSTLAQLLDIRLPPSISKGPDAFFIFRNDESVKLECQASGMPTVSYEWKKNGFSLNAKASWNIIWRDGSIIIDPATSLDEGYYHCYAKNQYGVAVSNTSSLRRTFLDNSGGSSSVLTKEVVEGQPFHIQAVPLKSFPNPTYGWESAADAVDKSPVPIKLSKRMQISENGDLYFSYALMADDMDGKLYKCTTYNPYMDVKAGGSYTKLTVKKSKNGPVPFQPTVAFTSNTQIVAVEGGNVSLRCFFSGFPDPIIRWKGPGNALPIGRYNLENENTELKISKIVSSDEGDYVCTASNSQGENFYTLQIKVEARPRFTTTSDSPHNVNVTEGGSYTFYCNPNAKPEAKIIWLMNGDPIDENNLPIRFFFSNNRKKLTVENICRNCVDREQSYSDLMVIQCNVSNVHGYAFGAGYLNVLSPTKVSAGEGIQTHTVDMFEEREFKFECTVTSDPSTPIKLKWFKLEGDRKIPVQEKKPVVSLSDGFLIIHVVPNNTKIWELYAGKYECFADNGYSEDFVVMEIKIRDDVPPGEEEDEETDFIASEVKAQTARIGDWWWLFFIIALILILLLLLLGCCRWLFRNRRNKGDKYTVYKKERKNGGSNPEKELIDSGFQDCKRPEGQTVRGSRGSLGDEASLNESGDDSGKFSEDGSFVGAYMNTDARKKGHVA